MTIFQIIASLFAFFMIYVVSIHGKKRTLSLVEVTAWCSLWVLFIIIALFPDLLKGITGVLRFARVFDLLVVLALMVLTVVIFMSYFAQKESQYKLEKFVRERAITDAREESLTQTNTESKSAQKRKSK